MTPTTVAVELSRRWLNSTATLQLATVANKPSPLNIHRYPLQIADTHSKSRPFAFLQTGDDLTSGDPSHSLPSPKPSSPSWRFVRFRSRQFIRFTIAKTQLQLATVANKSSSSPSPSFRRNRDDSAPKRFGNASTSGHPSHSLLSPKPSLTITTVRSLQIATVRSLHRLHSFV